MRFLLLAGGLAMVPAAGRLRRYAIAHASMAPALQPGDYVIAARTRRLRRGDVVVFRHPIDPTLELVKRVVGLPGERVTVDNGRLEIDAIPITDHWSAGATPGSGSWQLGDEVFVLGDQRSRSIDDSRSLGGIPVWRVPWKVQFRYWPPSRIGAVAAGTQRHRRRRDGPDEHGTRVRRSAVDMALHRDVDAPIEVVWAIITDIERSPEVIDGIDAVERLDAGDRFGVGTRWEETRTMFGRQTTEEMEITALEPGTSYTVEADGRGAHYVSTMSLEPLGDRTRLSMSFAAEPDGLVGTILANTLGRLMMGSTRKALLQDLDDIAQAART